MRVWLQSTRSCSSAIRRAASLHIVVRPLRLAPARLFRFCSGMRIARKQLIFLGLVALDEVVHHCLREPYPRTFALRATLAMLHALSDRERAPFVAFWRACSIPNGPEHEPYSARDRRVNEVSGAFQAICRALGCPPTITLGEDIAAAQRDPGLHARAYQARHRVESEEECARRLYAEVVPRSAQP